jgi:hypothetical protein
MQHRVRPREAEPAGDLDEGFVLRLSNTIRVEMAERFLFPPEPGGVR